MVSSRLKLFTFFIFLLFVASLIAGAHVVEFCAKRINNAVVLEWSTETETGLSHFNIERSIDNINWIFKGKVTAYGETSEKRDYSFIDNSIFKSSQSTFYYRLVLVDKNDERSTHPVIASVNGNSGIKHTWGSIKAMFR